ncbi:MAG: tetratricopeptide repeat protein [Candidatus Eremiobacteraeota bacterium]|nr:tetratricopeptide repeat protein [Candidatus Eremiobacteraeota bacterium]
MSDELQALLREADTLFEQSEWDQAQEKFIKILQRDPQNEEACYKIARIYSIRGLISNVVNQYFQLMDILEAKGDLDQAVEFAQLIQMIQPENDKARLKIIMIHKKKGNIAEVVKQSLQLARLYVELGLSDQSIMLLQNAQEYAPNNLDIGLELAEMYMTHGHIQEAASQYRKIANAYLQKNNLEKAAEAFRRMKVIVSDDEQLLLTLGNIYVNLNRFNEAEAEYRAVLRLDLNNVEALMALGNVCQLKGQFRDAILAFNKILSINPQEVKAKEKLGELHQAQGNHIESIKNYLSAAHIYQSIDETEKAIRIYQRVLTLDPTNPTACRELTNLGAPLVGDEEDEPISSYQPRVAPIPELGPTMAEPPVAAEMPELVPPPPEKPQFQPKPAPESPKPEPIAPVQAAPPPPRMEAPPLPSFDTHSMEIPSLDGPSLEIPSLEVPDLGGFDVPSLDAPSFEVPSLEVPSLDTPFFEPPPLEMPSAPMAGAQPSASLFEPPSLEMPQLDTAPKGGSLFDAPGFGTQDFGAPAKEASLFDTPSMGKAPQDSPFFEVSPLSAPPPSMSSPFDMPVPSPAPQAKEPSYFDMPSVTASVQESPFFDVPSKSAPAAPVMNSPFFDVPQPSPPGPAPASSTFFDTPSPEPPPRPQKPPAREPQVAARTPGQAMPRRVEEQEFKVSSELMQPRPEKVMEPLTDEEDFDESLLSGKSSMFSRKEAARSKEGLIPKGGLGAQKKKGLVSREKTSLFKPRLSGEGGEEENEPGRPQLRSKAGGGKPTLSPPGAKKPLMRPEAQEIMPRKEKGVERAPQSLEDEWEEVIPQKGPPRMEIAPPMDSSPGDFGMEGFEATAYEEAPQEESMGFFDFGDDAPLSTGLDETPFSSTLEDFSTVPLSPSQPLAPQAPSAADDMFGLPPMGDMEITFPGDTFGEPSQPLAPGPATPSWQPASQDSSIEKVMDTRRLDEVSPFSKDPIIDISMPGSAFEMPFGEEPFGAAPLEMTYDVPSGDSAMRNSLGFSSDNEGVGFGEGSSPLFGSPGQGQSVEEPISFWDAPLEGFPQDSFLSPEQSAFEVPGGELGGLPGAAMASPAQEDMLFPSDQPLGEFSGVETALETGAAAGEWHVPTDIPPFAQVEEAIGEKVGPGLITGITVPFQEVQEPKMSKLEEMILKLRDILEAGDYSAAIETYQKILADYPGNIDLRTELADLYYNCGLTDEALEQYEILCQKDPQRIDYLQKLATINLWQQKTERAESVLLSIARTFKERKETPLSIEYFQAVLALNKDNVDAREEIIDIYLEQKTEKAALYHLNVLAQLAMENVDSAKSVHLLRKIFDLTNGIDVQLKLAEAYERAGTVEEAVKEYSTLAERYKDLEQIENASYCLQKIVMLQPGSVDAHQQLVSLYKKMGDESKTLETQYSIAALFIESGEKEHALPILEEVVKAKPDHHDARHQLINLYLEKNMVEKAMHESQILADVYFKEKKVEQAVDLYQKLVAADPYNLALRERLAHFYMMSDNSEKALKEVLTIAKNLTTMENWDEAIKTYKKALQIDERNTDTRHQLAIILLEKKGNVKEALQELSRVFDMDPGHKENTKKYVEVLLREGKPEDAMRVLDKLIALDASNEQFRQEIVDSYRKKVEENKDDVQSRFYLGIIYKELKRLDDAIEQFQKTKRADEYNLQSSNMLALCFAMKPGMQPIAIKTLKKAIEEPKFSDEDKLELRYNLGILLESTNKIQDALAIYQDIFKVDITYKDVAQKIKHLKEQQQSAPSKVTRLIPREPG